MSNIYTHIYIYIYKIYIHVVTKFPTFIKDSSDAIRLLKDVKCTDDYQIRHLFTMDMCFLYTNTPTAEGLAALKYYLEYYPDENRPTTPTLLRLTELSLSLSSVEFDGKCFIKKALPLVLKWAQVMHVCLLAALRRCFSRTMVPNLLR